MDIHEDMLVKIWFYLSTQLNSVFQLLWMCIVHMYDGISFNDVAMFTVHTILDIRSNHKSEHNVQRMGLSMKLFVKTIWSNLLN